jgi:hypothetical protein
MRIEDIKIAVGQRILGPLCLFIFCGILYAGLNPFNPHPPDEVSWSAGLRGLRFGDYGMIRSSSAIQWKTPRGQRPCSLEIWLQPGLIQDTNTFLAFYTPEFSIPFSVHQWTENIVLVRETRDQQGRPKSEKMAVDHVFRKGRSSLITITSDTRQTSIYVDGILADTSPNLHLSSADLTGQLEFGNSPVANDSWAGLLRGFALYEQQLPASQVLDHYKAWTRDGQPVSDEQAGVVALYLFREGTGKLIHNEVPSGPNLYIPEHYEFHGQPLLAPPWKEFSLSLSYAKDVLINIAGFIPFGFFFCAYFSVKRKISRPALITILSGGAISLTIEILQAYLPMRDSGMTDVIMNTLGTALGVRLYGWKTAHDLLAEVGIPGSVERKE